MLAFYRIYFAGDTGEPLETAWAKGDIRVPAQEEDYANLPGLAGRSAADTICWEQLTEDTELEGLMCSKKPVFDITQNPPVLSWVDWPEPEQSDEDEISADEALAIMMGGESA